MQRDYAVFDGDRFVTNAILTDEEAERMRATGYKLIVPDETIAWGTPAFRGRGYVRRETAFRRGWHRD